MGFFDRQREGMGLQRADMPVHAADDQAIARYLYLLRTAPPEAIEQAHAEAFAKLSPEQRRRVLDEIAREIPEPERAAAVRAGDSPEQLARVATRAEFRQPGVMERVFGGMPGRAAVATPSFGGLLAGSLLSSLAGTVLGTLIAQQFFHAHPEANHLFGDMADRGDASQSAEDQADASDDDPTDGTHFADDSGSGGDLDMGFGGDDTFDV